MRIDLLDDNEDGVRPRKKRKLKLVVAHTPSLL